MTQGQRSALFWVFLALFVGIVVVALLVALGVGPFGDAAPAFQNLAIGTILAGVFGAVLTTYRVAFSGGRDLFITLDFEGTPGQNIDLVPQGDYEIWDQKKGRVGRTGHLLAQFGQGGWSCRLPGHVGRDDSVRFVFRDRSGQQWEVRYFSPLFNEQPVVRRQ